MIRCFFANVRLSAPCVCILSGSSPLLTVYEILGALARVVFDLASLANFSYGVCGVRYGSASASKNKSSQQVLSKPVCGHVEHQKHAGAL